MRCRNGRWVLGAVALALLTLVFPALQSGWARANAASSRAADTAHVGLQLPADHVYQRTVPKDRAVVFRHGTHFTYAGDRCVRCHPQPFRILTSTPIVTHAEMDSGRACGICHDGRHAFATRDSASCHTCHSGSATAVPGISEAQLEPIVYPRGPMSLGTVRFCHGTHLTGETTCSTCHPRPFAMRIVTAREPGSFHEPGACAKCHDRRHAFGMDDAAVCSRCHVRRAAP